MKLYKKITILTLLCIPLSLFGNIGVGLTTYNFPSSDYSDNRENVEFLIPIQLNPGFRLEPSIRYSSHKNDYNDTSWDEIENSQNDVLEISLGLFYTKHINEKTTLYLGPKIGYISYTNKYTYTWDDEDSYSESNTMNGYSFSPCIGMEYEIIENLRFGGEVSIRYEKTNGDIIGDEEEYGSSETESTTTISKFIMRYFF